MGREPHGALKEAGTPMNNERPGYTIIAAPVRGGSLHLAYKYSSSSCHGDVECFVYEKCNARMEPEWMMETVLN